MVFLNDLPPIYISITKTAVHLQSAKSANMKRLLYFGMIRLTYFALLLFAFAHALPAQNIPCANDLLHSEWMATDAGYADRMEAQNEIIAQATQKLWDKRAAGDLSKSGTGTKVYTIPVVVHIIHHPDSSIGKITNIPNSQVTAAIAHLNEGFKNAGVYDPATGEDIDIEFCLATTNPSGNSTTGITRYGSVAFTYLDFPVNDSIMKYTTGWNRSDYLNIWLPHTIADVQNNVYSYAGYAPPAGWHGTNRDGVVMRQDYFGSSSDNSKVLIHEVGHYLNLFHTFNMGCTNYDCRFQGDFVCDTPPDALSNGSFCNAINSCTTDANDVNSRNPFRPVNLGGIGDQNDMIENYMDYGNRYCQTVFTLGQKDRMRISLTAIRGTLLESNGCNTSFNKDVGITAIVEPGNFTCNGQATVTLKNYGNTVVNTAKINYQVNGSLYLYNWAGTLQPGKETNVLIDAGMSLVNGTYTFTAYSSLPDMWSDQNPMNDSASKVFHRIAANPLPFTENFEMASVINSQWLFVNPDNAITWQQATVGGCPANGAKAMRIDNRTYGSLGQNDMVYTAVSLFNYTTANLSFEVSYAMYSTNPSDQMRVVVSSDCGQSFSTLYFKQGQQLATTSPVTAAWTPANCSHWQAESINLSDYAGEDIIIGFANKCLNGNRLFIDNVNITGTEEILCFPPAGLSASGVSYNTATLNWTSTQTGALFNIKYRPVGSDNWSNEIYYYSGTSIPIQQLTVGTTYEVFLQNACSNGYNSTYITTTFTTSYTSCPPPVELSVHNIEKYSATIKWEGGDNASAFLVYYAPQSSPLSETMLISYTDEITLTELYLNVSYSVRVKTVCVGGTTSPIFSPSVQFTTAASCMPPNGLVVTDATSACAKVMWELEDDAVSYRVEHRPSGSTSWGSGTFVSSLFYNIPTLVPASFYEVRVRSTCFDAINSDYSYTVLMETAPACNTPTGLTVVGETDSSAILVWGEQAQSEIYNLRYRVLGSGSWTNLSSTGIYQTLGGLSDCTNYEFQVQSSCGGYSTTCTDLSNFSPSYYFSTFCTGYCTSSGLSASNLWIQNVALDAFAYNSGNNGGYNNYNLQTISLGQGLKIPLALTEGTPRKLTDSYWKVWIDYDQNLVFDAAELVFNAANPSLSSVFSTTPLTTSGFINIPEVAPLGVTRMRIALSTDGNVLPCDVFASGEVEDYLVEIVPGGGKSEVLQPQITLYPNPANEIVQISALLPDDQIPAELVIYNVLGQLVQAPLAVLNNQTTSVNVSMLSPGIYWCALLQNKQTMAVHKMVVVR